MSNKKWKIEIERFRGFAPKFFEDDYPSYGNKDQAGAMQNISLFNPSAMKPGPGMAELTNGDQGGVVDTLIKGITPFAVTSNTAYAIGGAKLYKLASATVSSGGSPSWPRTIDKASVTGEDGEDVCHYRGALFYSYNHSGSAGDVGRYDLSSTFDDDYFSAAATSGAALEDAPHQMFIGGDDIMYITNGSYMAYLDGTTANAQALNFWTDAQIASATWNYNRVYIGVNRPNISGSNFNQSGIYRWNGYSSSWESDPIEVKGRIGALYTSNGITYVWYETFLGGTAYVNFGYIAGGQVQPLVSYQGTLPLYYQVGEVGDYITWQSGGKQYAFGPMSNELPVDFFQFMSPQYTTSGGMAAPFGEILVSSTDGGSNFSLEKESGFDTDASFKTLLFPVAEEDLKSIAKKIVLKTNKLASGARVDLTLRDNKGNALWTEEMSFATDGDATQKTFTPNATGENMRLEIDHSNGSSTNGVEIRGVIIKGVNVPMA